MCTATPTNGRAGTKQHHRLAHSEHWALRDAALSLCSAAGLVASAPCVHCGETFQDPRSHIKRCSVLYQVAVACLSLQQDGGGAEGGLATSRGLAGDSGCLGRAWNHRDEAEGRRSGGPQETPGGGEGRIPAGQMEPASLQRPSGQRTAVGILEALGCTSGVVFARGGTLDAATLHLLRALVKTTIRLDEDVSRLRADGNFMLFIDSVSEANTLLKLREAAQTWQESFTAGKVTTSLRVILFCGLLKLLRTAVEEVQTDDNLRDKLLRVGWLEDGVNALLPAWRYFRWDPTAQRQVVSEKPPLPQDRLLPCLEILEKGCANPATLLRFRSTRKLGDDTEAEVTPFLLSISLRGAEATACHEALTMLTYIGALKMLGMLGLRLCPERVQQSTTARELAEAYVETSFTDWTRRPTQWQQKSRPSRDAEMK